MTVRYRVSTSALDTGHPLGYNAAGGTLPMAIPSPGVCCELQPEHFVSPLRLRSQGHRRVTPEPCCTAAGRRRWAKCAAAGSEAR